MQSAFLALCLIVPALALQPLLVSIDVTEWQVPYRMDADGALHDGYPTTAREATRPRDPYVHPDGRVFFCGQSGNYVASFDPETETFQRYELPAGTHPHNLIIDDAGMVWYAGNRASHIGRLDPASGVIQQYPMPDPEVRDPHTLMWDRNGDIWFTAQTGNRVGKVTVATGTIQLVPVPTERARPYGIVMDPSGMRPWIALFGTNKLATVDPVTMELSEIPLPREAARPRRLQVTSDGNVWYVDYAEGHLGRYDPDEGTFAEWPMPAGAGSRPYALAVDEQDRLWAFQGPRDAAVTLVGFEPGDAEFFSTTLLESGPGTVRHAYFHPPTSAIWFGTDANTIGRVVVP
jgi:virginiamycin B lyase